MGPKGRVRIVLAFPPFVLDVTFGSTDLIEWSLQKKIIVISSLNNI